MLPIQYSYKSNYSIMCSGVLKMNEAFQMYLLVIVVIVNSTARKVCIYKNKQAVWKETS